MKAKEEIEKILTDLGRNWPAEPSLADRVARAIESSPFLPKPPRLRSIIMKSIIGIAVSVAIFAVIWWGVDNQGSLYAQVMGAVHKARTVHIIDYGQSEAEAEPLKSSEFWYEKTVGFRCENDILGTINIATNEAVWSYNKKQNLASRSKSEGIDKTAPPDFLKQIDQIAQRLQDECERYPAGDKEIDGVPCKAYRLSKPDKESPEEFKSEISSGKRQMLIYIDQQSRLLRVIMQVKENNQYKTVGFSCYKYDEPFDPALFRPDFGKGVKIVDADKVFDEFVDLKKAIYTEQRGGIIIAIHRVQRFENGGVMFVCSVRGTEETLKKNPPTTFDETFRSPSMAEGPACNQWSHRGMDGFHKRLAYGSYQGISVSWWAIIPTNSKPDCLEAAPNKIRLHIGLTPRLKFRYSLTENQIHVFESGWDIVVDAPRSTAIPSVEEIAKSVFVDLVALKAVCIAYLEFYSGKNPASDQDIPETKGGTIEEISSDEYAKQIVRDVKAIYVLAINEQIDEQFEPENWQKKHEFVYDRGNVIYKRVIIDLTYNPEVNDATLKRVAVDDPTFERPAKRDIVTEIYLQGTHITDAGLKHLRSLKNLKKLDLAETSITDEGLKHLTPLVNLKHLNLTNTKVTAEGIVLLKKAIPGVEIEWGK